MTSSNQLLGVDAESVLQCAETWLVKRNEAKSDEARSRATVGSDGPHPQILKTHSELTAHDTDQAVRDWRQICTVAPVPGRGMGVIATCKIPAGTCIAVEEPLLLVERTGKSNFMGVIQAFDQLTPQQKDDYLQLAVSPDAIAKAEKEALKELGFSLERLGPNAALICGIEATNAWELREGRSAVLHLGSRFNHSCIASVKISTKDESGVSTYRNAVDLNVGEELMVSYIGPDNMAPRAERQRLLEQWGFECACEACEKTPANQLRERLHNTYKQLREIAEQNKDLAIARRAALLLFEGHEEALEYDIKYVQYGCTLAEHDLLDDQPESALQWLVRCRRNLALSWGLNRNTYRAMSGIIDLLETIMREQSPVKDLGKIWEALADWSLRCSAIYEK